MRLKFYLMGLGIGVIVAAVIMGIAMRGRTREMTDEEIMARARQLGMVEAGTLAEMASGENNQNADQNREESAPAPAQEEARAEAGASASDTGTAANAGGATATVLEASVANSAQTAQTSVEGDEGGTGRSDADRDMVVEGEPVDDEDSEEEEEADGDDEADDAAAADQVANASASAGTEDRAEASANSAGGRSTVAGTGASGGEGSAASGSSTSDSAQSSGSIVVTIPDGLYSEDIAALLENAGVVDNAAAFNDYLVNSGNDRYITVGARLIPRGASYEDVARIITGR